MKTLPLFSIALLSASALAYELLLMRLFSIIHWHHFAYMIIGLALLGYGFSGSLIALMQDRLIRHFQTVYPLAIALFSLSSIICFEITQTLSFNTEEILWDFRQSLLLLAVFVLLSLPFFFAGAAICLAFLFYKDRLNQLYAADLFGAGGGCIGVVGLLNALFPDHALVAISALGLCAALIAGIELKFKPITLASYFFCLSALLVFLAMQLQLAISPYKSLPHTLLINGMEIVSERSSPLGLITVVNSKKIPFRHAPGMSIASPHQPLPQLAVFTDADNMSVITGKAENIQQLAYLGQMTSALPYVLKPSDQVLIIGSGGGADVLQAKFHQAAHIHAVELNPQYIELVSQDFADFSGDIYQQANIDWHIADGRDYLTSHENQYDLIQISLLDSFNASVAGLYALNENYLYTTEALKLYVSRLKPGGYLSITRWLKLPPRDALKLFTTVLEAFKTPSIRQNLVMIRSWQTTTLLIKNGAFNAQEIAQVENFSAERNFDLVYTPTIKEAQANRYNVLKQAWFYQGAQALLSGDSQTFIENYKFNLRPASDDQPYFQHFFRWSSLPEMLSLLSKGGAGLIETGYLIIFATLCIAILTSLFFILGPLFRLPKNPSQTKLIKRRHVAVYFFAIGLAFLMIEIAFIQKFILFLHHPVYSLAITLTAFLVFAGFGSAYCKQFSKNAPSRFRIVGVISLIVALSLAYLCFIDDLFQLTAAWPLIAKFILSILLIAPLAFFMGMPMPLALNSLAQDNAHLIPWAWGINGCASVISSVAATLLAMQFGFSIVILTAVICYLSVIGQFPASDSAMQPVH